MEIKIQCDCGQRYKLDVEPIDGRMPHAVNCPVCGVEGTQKGNILIQQVLATATVQPLVPAPPAPGKLKLSLSAATHAATPVTAVEPPAPVSPPALSGNAEAVEDAPAAVAKPRKPSFGMGLLGGFAGALVGSILYYVIVKATGIRLSYFAIGVGGLAGWMCELIGKGEGSKELAGITATITVACIIAAQYFLALGYWHHVLGADIGQSLYDTSVQQAKVVVKAVPTGSDAEIRTYLANEEANDAGAKPDPAAVSADDIKQFRDTLLPGMRDLAEGKISRDQYNSQNGIDPVKEQQKQSEVEGDFKTYFILMLIRKSTLFSLAAAAALAFRLCANA